MATQVAELSPITRPSQVDQAQPTSTSSDASFSLLPSRTRRVRLSLRSHQPSRPPLPPRPRLWPPARATPLHLQLQL
ncbi:hypothetical protein TorRG33x02_048680, partial [Trema orientale]